MRGRALVGFLMIGMLTAVAAFAHTGFLPRTLKSGTETRYTELAGEGHGSWVPAYDSVDAIHWLFAQCRGVR